LILVMIPLAGCCEILRLEAEALERQYARCETDEQCVAHRYFDDAYTNDAQPLVGNTCHPTFQCSVALAADADLDEFACRAREISDRYSASCPMCMSASCMPSGGASCDAQTGLCQLGDGPGMAGAVIEVDSHSLQFGVLQPGMELTLPLTVRSVGVDTLYLEDFLLRDDLGFDASPFSVDDSAVERILAPGAHTEVPVTCTLVEEATHAGLLIIRTNAGGHLAHQVPLRCDASDAS